MEELHDGGGASASGLLCSDELLRVFSLPTPLNSFVEKAFAEANPENRSSSPGAEEAARPEVRVLRRLFGESLALFVNGKGVDAEALSAAAEEDCASSAAEGEGRRNALCLLRGEATRRLLTAELHQLQQREGASSELVVKALKQVLAFALSFPAVSFEAKAAFFSGAVHLLLLWVSGVPATNAQRSSLDLNVVVDIIADFSKVNPQCTAHMALSLSACLSAAVVFSCLVVRFLSAAVSSALSSCPSARFPWWCDFF